MQILYFKTIGPHNVLIYQKSPIFPIGRYLSKAESKQPLKTVKHKYYKNNFRRVEKTETGAGELKWTTNWMTLSTLIKLLNVRIRSNKKC